MRAEPHHLWLGHVIVQPEARGYGLGQTLVRKLLAYGIKRHRAKLASLIVFPENVDAIECYHRVGFQTTGEEHHRFSSGPKERLLRLQLDLNRFET